MPSVALRGLGAALVCVALACSATATASAQDVIPPVSTMTTSGDGPNADGWSKGNRFFTIDAVDEAGGSGVEKIVYEVVATGANSLPPTTFLGTRETFQVRNEGYYTVRWYAVDRAGNAEAPQSASFKSDSSSPVIGEPVLQGTRVGAWFRDTVTITASVFDPVLQDGNAGSGVKSVNWPLTRSTTTTDFARLEAVDVAGQEAVRLVDAKVDADAPQVSVTGCPVAPVQQGATVGVSVAATDVGSGLVADPTGAYDLATDTPGVHERVFEATDGVQHSSTAGCTYEVLASTPLYDFTGFFRPVSMTDLNVVNAGRAVPIKFSLGGDQGLDVIEAGYPKTVQVPCTSIDDTGTVEPTTTSTPGGSTLTYDPASDEYQYVWKTEKAWAGQCRQFVLKLDDGSTHRAYFRFR